MSAVAPLAALSLAVVGLAACGSRAPTQQSAPTSLADFECRDRRAAYIVRGGFAGSERGVVMDCAASGPRVYTWRLLDSAASARPGPPRPGDVDLDGDERQTAEHSLTPDQFEDVWERLEATGWRNLGDCTPSAAADDDRVQPEYKIGVTDHTHTSSITCVGTTLPFPYNRLVDTLYTLAAEYEQ